VFHCPRAHVSHRPRSLVHRRGEHRVRNAAPYAPFAFPLYIRKPAIHLECFFACQGAHPSSESSLFGPECLFICFFCFIVADPPQCLCTARTIDVGLWVSLPAVLHRVCNIEEIESNYTPPYYAFDPDTYDCEFQELQSFKGRAAGTCQSQGYGTLGGLPNKAAFEPTFVIAHAVGPQDTLAGICLRYMLSDRQVELLNPGVALCKVILASQELLLPVTRYNVEHLIAMARACDTPEAPPTRPLAAPPSGGTNGAEASQHSVGSFNREGALYVDEAVVFTEETLILRRYYFATGSPKVVPYGSILQWFGTSLHYLGERYAVPCGAFATIQSRVLTRDAHDKCLCLRVAGQSLPILFLPNNFGRVQELLRQKVDGGHASDSDTGSEASDSGPGSPLAAILKDWTVLQAREYGA